MSLVYWIRVMKAEFSVYLKKDLSIDLNFAEVTDAGIFLII